jgi:hypothetical protein
VAYHLYKAYPKLGIRARAELNGVLVPRDQAESVAAR